MIRHITVGAALASALMLAIPARAQEAVHVRGEVAAVEGDTVTLAATDGTLHEITMSEDYALMVYEGIDLADVTAGDYLSIPSIPSPEGEKIAVSVNVFPENMRGTGEGERAWDLTETSRMTNATLGEVVDGGDSGAVIVVAHGGTEEPILVPEGTPITRFAPDPDRRLQAGDEAVLFVDKIDGAAVASFAGISDDGSLPPI